MSELRRLVSFLLALSGIFFLPLVALLIRTKGKIPYDFFFYPPTSVGEKAGYNPYYFYSFMIVGIVTLIFLLFPQLFGFKKKGEYSTVVSNKKFTGKKPMSNPAANKVPLAKPAISDFDFSEAEEFISGESSIVSIFISENDDESSGTINLPSWFWWGLAIHLVSLALLWSKVTAPGYLTHFLLIPLWWGFVFVLDGIVYLRTRGKSPMVVNPRSLLAMAVASSTGWMVFDYVNYYIDENWYYPNGKLINPTVFYSYGLIGSSAFLPQIFEWSILLKSTSYFKNKYSGGPAVRFSPYFFGGMMFAGFVFLFVVVYYPQKLFYAIWLSPLFILVGLLPFFRIWSPANPITERGDWSVLVIIAIAGLIQGTLWEFWNFFSVEHCPFLSPGMCPGSEANNPAFWEYAIPYVNVRHIFEMPVLGYFGYIPFAIFYLYWHLALNWIFGVRGSVRYYFG